MINLKNQRVLIIAPHPDDEVFGCGGFIHRCKEEGAKVYILFMTVGTTKDFSKKGLSTQKERVSEIERVASFLKYDDYRIAFPGDERHLRLDTCAQKELIDEIEQGKRISLQTVKPTILMTCHTNDYNQDHRMVGQASVTATRPTPTTFKNFQKLVFTYEYPPSSWSDRDTISYPNFFIELSKANLHAKLKALRLYKSQLKNHNGPLSVHAVKTLAHLRGVQSGVAAAEAFFVKRVLV